MTNVGQAILTVRGALALADATRTGRNIKPRYYKVSKNDTNLDPTLTDLSGVWRQADISGYFPISDNTVEFVIDIAPEQAIDYGKTFGLFLDDGTLFMIAKPPYPFPPALRQTLKVQLVYQNVNNIVNFQYIPFYETEQDLAILDVIFTTSERIKILREDVELLKLAKERLFASDRETANAISRIDENIQKIKSELEVLHANQIALATDIQILSYLVAQNTASISALINNLKLKTI